MLQPKLQYAISTLQEFQKNNKNLACNVNKATGAKSNFTRIEKYKVQAEYIVLFFIAIDWSLYLAPIIKCIYNFSLLEDFQLENVQFTILNELSFQYKVSEVYNLK